MTIFMSDPSDTLEINYVIENPSVGQFTSRCSTFYFRRLCLSENSELQLSVHVPLNEVKET